MKKRKKEDKFRKTLKEKLQNSLNDEEYIVLEHKKADNDRKVEK